MNKEKLINVVSELVISNNKSINELKEKIDNGGNKKSVESVICGINKNISLLLLIGKCLNGDELNDDDVKLINRLGYNRKIEWIEISKEVYLKEEGYLSKEYKIESGKYYKKG